MALKKVHLLTMVGLGALAMALPAARGVIDTPAEAAGRDVAARTAMLLPETGNVDFGRQRCCELTAVEHRLPGAGPAAAAWEPAAVGPQMAQAGQFGAYPPVGYDPEQDRKDASAASEKDAVGSFSAVGGSTPLQAPGYMPLGGPAGAPMPMPMPMDSMSVMSGMSGMSGDGVPVPAWGQGGAPWPLPHTGAEPISVNDHYASGRHDWSGPGWGGSDGAGNAVPPGGAAGPAAPGYPGMPRYSDFPPEGGTADSQGGTAYPGYRPYGAPPRVDGYGGYGGRPPAPPAWPAPAAGYPGGPVPPAGYGPMPGYGFAAPYPPAYGMPGYPYAPPAYAQPPAPERPNPTVPAGAASPWNGGAPTYAPAAPGMPLAPGQPVGTAGRDKNLPYSTGPVSGHGFPPGGFTPEAGGGRGGALPEQRGSNAVTGVGVAVYPPNNGALPSAGNTVRVDFGSRPAPRSHTGAPMTASISAWPPQAPGQAR